jgi:transcriptional regulator with XRE-family HTH domain
MTANNTLLSAPPYAVEQALKRLGANLRTARLRRNLTIGDVADKIGTGPRPVSDAEKGKPGVSAAVYIALLWVYDLLDQMDDVARPELDAHGLSLSMGRERLRAREKKELDNEF